MPPPLVAPASPPPEPEPAGNSVLDHIAFWIQAEGPWWLCSFVFHLILICSLGLIGTSAVVAVVNEAPAFNEVDANASDKEAPKELERFVLGETPEDPTELNTETLTLEPAGGMTQEEEYNDDNPIFSPKGGGVSMTGNEPPLGGFGFDVKGIGPGPAHEGKGGAGGAPGFGTHPGVGGEGLGFGSRGTGNRKAMLGTGGTRQSEQAVRGALYWLARAPNGRWKLEPQRLLHPLQGQHLYRARAVPARKSPARPSACSRSSAPEKRMKKGFTKRTSTPDSTI